MRLRAWQVPADHNRVTASATSAGAEGEAQFEPLPLDRAPLPVILASVDEVAEHEKFLDLLDDNGGSLWRTAGQA